MKRTGALLLMLALCLLLLGVASAEAGPVGKNGTIAAYVDGDGHLYLTGRASAINTARADSVVSADAYRVLYFSADAATGVKDLYMIDLASFKDTLLAKDVHDAALFDEDTAYFVANASRENLMRLDLNTKASSVATTAVEPIDRLYVSAEGLVIELVDQAGRLLQVQETGAFEPYTASLPRESDIAYGYEVYLTDEGDLYLRNDFNYSSEFLDGDVLAYAVLKNNIYYLSHSGTAVRLMEYDTAAQQGDVILTPEVPVESQLTASANALFMLGSDGSIYTVDIAKGTMALYKKIDVKSYAMPSGLVATGLRIEAMSGQLNAYAKVEEKAAKPDFSFIEFGTETEVADEQLRLVEKLTLAGETTAWDELKPVEQYTTLARGSRGDAVRAIQQPLYDKGYYDYHVDGIYGWRTELAVQMLQDDLGLTVNGVADANLQRTILSGISAYDPYRELARGKRGMRVTNMQEHLRDLGYLADAADGIFGPRTQKAVQLFQKENGIAVNDRATAETLRLLYSDRANRCSSFIDLYPGDTGYRVRELNNRLRDLYYLESSVGSRYTSETTSAVRVFQRTAGLRETGQATVPVLKALFADGAPEVPGFISLRRGDENSRVERLQRRLAELGYYDGKISGYFGKSTKEAVQLFQNKVGLKPTGVATVKTQQLLFASDAPIYVPPTVIGAPVITLDYFDHMDGSTYCVTDTSSANGYITFNWFAEGQVAEYNVLIIDANGNVYLNNRTMLNQTGVSVSTLAEGLTYTIEITAYPADGDVSHITANAATFRRVVIPTVPEIGTIGNPEISIDDVARVEGGIHYVQPGNIVFHWKAEGDVSGYYWEIRDESDNVILKTNTTDEGTTVATSTINQGEQYTIFVYAIPKNGTIDNARVKFLRFALPVVELPSPDPTPEPTPTPTPEPTLEPTPEPTAEPTPEPAPTETAAPGAENTEAPAEQPAEPAPQEPQTDNAPASNEQAEQPAEQPVEQPAEQPVEQPAEQPVEQPAEQPVEQPAEQSAEQPVEQPAEQPADQPPAEEQKVSAPMLAFSPTVAVEDEVNIVDKSAETLTMSFPAEGEVASYAVEVLDSNANTLASTTVDSSTESLNVRMSNLAEGEVYTLNVMAIPEGGTIEDGQLATAQFAIESDEAPTVETPAEEPIPEQPVEQPAEEPVPDQPEEQPEPEPEPAPEPQEPVIGVVTPPTVTFDFAEYDEAGVAVIPYTEEYVTMNWAAEGDVAGYVLTVYDPNGAELGTLPVEADAHTRSVPAGSLQPGLPYTLNVTAIPVNGTAENGQTTSALFMVQNAPAPEPEPEPIPAEEPVYEEPQPEYVEPEPEYVESQPEYVEPEPEYVEPEPEYVEAEPEYVEPEPEYVEPEPEYVEPEPEYVEPEPEYVEPEPEPEVFMGYTWTEPVNAYTDYDRLVQVQERLKQLGWLPAGYMSDGTLNADTVSAVYNFQSYLINNYGTPLTLIGSDVTQEPYIDVATLNNLMSVNGNYYVNPAPVVVESAPEAPAEEPAEAPVEEPAENVEEYADEGAYEGEPEG